MCVNVLLTRSFSSIKIFLAYCGKVFRRHPTPTPPSPASLLEAFVIPGLSFILITASVVNEILSDHNVDKQMTDSRGDVRNPILLRCDNLCGQN